MPFNRNVSKHAPFSVAFQQQVAAGTMLTTYGLFAAPLALGEAYEFLGADYSYDVASNSGTLDLRVTAVTVAYTGGSSLLSATQSLSATARTARKATITTTQATRFLMPGSQLSMILGGTLTNLVGFNVTVWLQKMRGIRAR